MSIRQTTTIPSTTITSDTYSSKSRRSVKLFKSIKSIKHDNFNYRRQQGIAMLNPDNLTINELFNDKEFGMKAIASVNRAYFDTLLCQLFTELNSTIKVEISNRLSSSTGICTNKNLKSNNEIIIRLSGKIFRSIDITETNAKSTSGLVATSPIEAMYITLEHEIIHAIMQVMKVGTRGRGVNSAPGKTFKDMVLNIYGHTECKHNLLNNGHVRVPIHVNTNLLTFGTIIYNSSNSVAVVYKVNMKFVSVLVLSGDNSHVGMEWKIGSFNIHPDSTKYTRENMIAMTSDKNISYLSMNEFSIGDRVRFTISNITVYGTVSKKGRTKLTIKLSTGKLYIVTSYYVTKC